MMFVNLPISSTNLGSSVAYVFLQERKSIGASGFYTIVGSRECIKPEKVELIQQIGSFALYPVLLGAIGRRQEASLG